MLVGNECWLYLLGLLVFAVFIIICVVCVKLERLTPSDEGAPSIANVCINIIYNFFICFYFLQHSTRLLHPETPIGH